MVDTHCGVVFFLGEHDMSIKNLCVRGKQATGFYHSLVLWSMFYFKPHMTSPITNRPHRPALCFWFAHNTLISSTACLAKPFKGLVRNSQVMIWSFSACRHRDHFIMNAHCFFHSLFSRLNMQTHPLTQAMFSPNRM